MPGLGTLIKVALIIVGGLAGLLGGALSPSACKTAS